ncbi:hypothetical protein L7F22_050918 [Adiantum nelumboides]|nr:hypothetical protein [Adiantum nelumboides]
MSMGMAIQYAGNDATSALRFRSRNGGITNVQLLHALDLNDISEEDIAEAAAAMVALTPSSSSGGNGKLLLRSMSCSSQCCRHKLHSSPSTPPVDIPLASRKPSCRSAVASLYNRQGSGVADTELEKEEQVDELKREQHVYEDVASLRYRHGTAPIVMSRSYCWAAPHVIVTRQHLASRRDLQVLAFSMTEGPGRTLKGRDLTNVRNAVWRSIGFPE